MHFLFTRHLSSGEALHEVIDAPDERTAVRVAKSLAGKGAADGRGGTVQVIDGAGRFLVERHDIQIYAPKGSRPA